MSAILRKIIIAGIFLFSSALEAEAQFLGQQSLSQSSYVIDQSGSLWAWGWNFYGQLGVGDRTNRSIPTQVPLPPGVSRWTLVAGGEYHAIAVGDSDKLYTWGLNDKGQIGNGTAGGLYVQPVLIKNPITVRSWKWVSAGADHCEALDQDGILYAWGSNEQGQLGAGSTKYLVAPEQVEFPMGVTSWGAVAAGPGYTMMVAQNGILFGCGMDSLGTFSPYEGPLPAIIPDTVRAYSPLPCLGASYKQESRIDNTWYEEQNALLFDSLDAPETVAGVADGGWHDLLLNMDGSIAASGDNSYGQLGVNSDSSYSPDIVPLPSGVTQFVAVAAGLRHSLAIGNDGWVYAWGDDSLGELGIGVGPKQIKPVRVMQVCSPLSMSVTFTIPANFFPGPYSISVNVKNTSSSSSLTNADAFLVLAGPLVYLDSSPDEIVASPIAPNATSSATWQGSVDQEYFDTISATYFAYIRAAGSAPLLIYGTPVTINYNLPWRVCDEANVIDSLTGAPIPGADLDFPGFPVCVLEPNGPPYDSNKMVSDENGIFSLCFNGPIFECNLRRVSSYQFNISKENYRSERYTLSEPQKEQVTFILGPSDIQGTFAFPAQPFIADSIVKVYYPDTLVGYAISRRLIFRTLDSGIHWSAMYEADEDLHDLKFIDPAIGWAVGDNGEILNTKDSGETWQITHIGSNNLRALALVDYDTSWAVGDGGTLLKRSGDTWTALSPMRDSSLTSIHFLDPENGVIGANGAFYVYSGGTWERQIVNSNLNAVYYVTPGEIYLAGTNGDLIEDSAGILLKYDSTYTAHTLNSLYFLNNNVGYVAGDSGSSFVTYDGGLTWADISEFPLAATSINFFSLAGHGVSDNGVFNYAGVPDTFKAIVRGRLTVGNPPIPVIGAEVDRYYFIHDSVFNGSTLIDNTYTNEQGNFVFTGIDAIFPYWYQVNFTDSGLEKTVKFPDTLAQRREIITLNYNDYTPPVPDTTLADVNSATEANLSLEVNTSQSIARIDYSIPSDGPIRLVMEDILGRTVRTIADGFIIAGLRETDVSLDGLPSGVYYIKLESAKGSLTKKIMLIQ